MTVAIVLVIGIPVGVFGSESGERRGREKSVG